MGVNITIIFTGDMSEFILLGIVSCDSVLSLSRLLSLPYYCCIVVAFC